MRAVRVVSVVMVVAVWVGVGCRVSSVIAVATAVVMRVGAQGMVLVSGFLFCFRWGIVLWVMIPTVSVCRRVAVIHVHVGVLGGRCWVMLSVCAAVYAVRVVSAVMSAVGVVIPLSVVGVVSFW